MRLLPTIIGKPTRLLSGLALCVAPLAVGAEEPISGRSYPPTYTDRVTPWYDPSGWYRKIESALAKDEPAAKPTITNTASASGSPGAFPTSPAGAGPAWKWYGYGTVTPYQNPLAPQGEYQPVPFDWHTRSGTTPGAVPHGGPSLLTNSKPDQTRDKTGSEPPPRTETPLLAGKPDSKTGLSDLIESPKSREDEKTLPAVLIPPAIVPATPVSNPGREIEVDATPAARIRIPSANKEETVPPSSVIPVPTAPGAVNTGASLRPPVRGGIGETLAPAIPEKPAVKPAPAAETPKPPVAERPMTPTAQPGTPVERPDGAALPTTNTDTPDLPVEAAPGIVIPGGSGSMSRSGHPVYTVRGQQPQTLDEAIRQVAGDIVRDVRSNGRQAIVVVLKPGNIDAAWQARERLSKMPELRRLTVTFEIAGR